MRGGKRERGKMRGRKMRGKEIKRIVGRKRDEKETR